LSTLLGVCWYEASMGIRRWGVWVATLLLAAPAINNLTGEQVAQRSVWTSAAMVAVLVNVLTPVVGGIAMADRLHRDSRLGVLELLRVTPLSRAAYVLGKYVGAVAGAVAPVLAMSLAIDVVLVLTGAPPALLGAQVVAFLTINVLTYLFVGAFSLACPLFLPLRVYQVMFTGYWFWGNFLNPRVFPTLAGTLLTPSGVYVASGLFAGDDRLPWWDAYTPEQGLANVALLLACAAAALLALDRYLALQEARA
jgi:ABC-2 type transport system permease protein